MKRIFILLVFIFQAQIGKTQNNKFGLKVTKSEIFKDDKKITKLLDSKSDGKGGLVVLRSYDKSSLSINVDRIAGYYIDHFDDELKLIKRHTIERKKNLIRKLIVSNNKIHLIETFRNKKQKTYDFNVLSSSLETFNFTKKNLISLDKAKFKEIFGTPMAAFYISSKTNNLNGITVNSILDITLSKENHFFSIVLNPIFGKTVKYKHYLFNDTFEKIYEKSFEKDIKRRLFDIHDIHIDDTDNSMYMISKVKKNKKEKQENDGDIKYHYELYKFTKEGEVQLKLDTQNHHIGSLNIIKDHGKLSCVGFYSDKNDSRYKGVALYVIDPESMQSKGAFFRPFQNSFWLISMVIKRKKMNYMI